MMYFVKSKIEYQRVEKQGRKFILSTHAGFREISSVSTQIQRKDPHHLYEINDARNFKILSIYS